MLLIMDSELKSGKFSYMIKTTINFDNVESFFIERIEDPDVNNKYKVIAETGTSSYELYKGNHIDEARYIYNKILESWNSNEKIVHLDTLLNKE